MLTGVGHDGVAGGLGCSQRKKRRLRCVALRSFVCGRDRGQSTTTDRDESVAVCLSFVLLLRVRFVSARCCLRAACVRAFAAAALFVLCVLCCAPRRVLVFLGALRVLLRVVCGVVARSAFSLVLLGRSFLACRTGRTRETLRKEGVLNAANGKRGCGYSRRDVANGLRRRSSNGLAAGATNRTRFWRHFALSTARAAWSIGLEGVEVAR